MIRLSHIEKTYFGKGNETHALKNVNLKIQDNELCAIMGASGSGKSTLTSIFADAFVDHGEKVGMIFLEEEIKDTVQRLIASRLKVSYIKFKSDPLSCASQEQIQEAYEYIVNQDRVVLLDHFGSLPVSELMAKIKHMHFVEGCSYILLDHLSMVISGSQVADERKELDMVMTELAAFCAANDVCIIAVSHINRTGADQFKPPKADGSKKKDKKEAGQGESEPDPLAWLKPDIDLTLPRETIARYINCKPMQAILSKHAYVRTVLFSMFISARSLGVLPPADMRWMRFYDRTLWYVLQNFGRQGAYAEGGAVHVHYLYEIKSGEPLVEPQLDKAISALEAALTAFKYRPADREAYRKGKTTIHEAVPEELTVTDPPSKT